ncbi:hypothetical protein [Vibrio sp. SCSIO 43137]|uniref:hypothetical protein n=1 Tax=Vibrio sp. SCSIO 43137 TaxID=3021011 RepID=UPI0023079A15|nr:hypothetical protein [Vibrio sp. SCSIO 43137]WCE30111.1 hypothetical protein PK654_02095 [Vibrio sp. SCSIO 43137]
MSQPHEAELQTLDNDWGDFSIAIGQLESQEKQQAQTEALTESHHSDTEPKLDNSEAVNGLLTVVFMITEKATSIVSGVDFEFDEKGKQEVISAAVPVLQKHDGAVAGWFGDYIEEATLILAVLGLVYAARHNIKVLKAEKAELEEQKRREQDGKKTKASTAKAA